MKAPRARIEAAVSTDQSRYALTNVWLEGDKAIATDGRIMAIVPVERQEGDVDGYLSRECLNAARMTLTKEVKLSKRFARVSRGDVTTIFKRETEATFPKWQALERSPDEKPLMTIGLDPNLLMKLFSAIAQYPKGSGVKIEIWGRQHAMRITPDGESSGAYGWLMPRNLHDNDSLPPDPVPAPAPAPAEPAAPTV